LRYERLVMAGALVLSACSTTGRIGQMSKFDIATASTEDIADNLQLSQRRAKAMVDALVKDGVAADRLAAVGVGPLSPVAPNDTPEGRAQNRRVELVLIS
jgi:flagellar motor protein MotB